MLLKGAVKPGQTIASCHRNTVALVPRVGKCCDMLGVVRSNLITPNMSQYIATVWSNACNMLRPTMLR